MKLTLFALLALTSTSLSAQNVLTVDADSGNVETIDLPEGMVISEEELDDDYNNKNNLTPGTGISRELSASDSLIITRLAKIPTTIEMPLNDVTRKFIDKYISMKGSVSTMLGASNFYFPIFEEALERYGLPLELKYLPVIESALRPSATSPAGAGGLWQFMIGTGKRYGLEVNTLVDERRDPYKASDAAAHYLSRLYSMFNDWGLAIAAYNCGEGNVQKAIARSGSQEGADYWTVYNRLPHETRGYVPAFIAATYIMNYYCDHGIVPKEATLPLAADTVTVQREQKFSVIASHCNMSIDELRNLNPQYRKDIIPVGYSLCLPSEKINSYIVYEDSICARNGGTPISTSDVRRAVTEDLESNTTKSTKKSRWSRSKKDEPAKVEAKKESVKVEETKSDETSVAAETETETKTETETQTTNKTESGYDSQSSRYSRRSKSDYKKDSKKESKKDSKKESKKDKKKKEKHDSHPVTTNVKNGDTLSEIAERHHTTVSKLRKLNGLKGDNIRAGATLRVK